MENNLSIYIFNSIEDELPYILGLRDKQKQLKEIEGSNSSTECYLFANTDKKELIYISPKTISQTFKDYFQRLTGISTVEILVPKNKTGLICKDTYLDKSLFRYLIKKAKDYNKVSLYAYATSSQFFDLKKRFTQHGINIVTPESSDEDNLWTINFFGSKAGIRQLFLQSQLSQPDFIMPEGVICFNRKDVAQIAAHRFLQKKGIVIKTNKGNGGNGLLLFHSCDLPNTYKSCEKKIYKYLLQNDFWEKDPIIVEDIIDVDFKSFSAFPNVEFKIHSGGKIEFLYYCVMTVSDKGSYSGLDMYSDVLNKETVSKIMGIGYFIAKKLSYAGYRGHFDIDMVETKNHKLFVTEVNTRNTGGTDIYKLAQRLIGKNFFSESYVISRDTLKLIFQKKIPFKEFLEILEPVLFSHKTKEGVVITSEDIFNQKQLLYVVFGQTKKRAYEIEKKMKQIIQKIN